MRAYRCRHQYYPQRRDGGQLIQCADCGCTFSFTFGQREFYRSQGYVPPRRCKPCRDLRSKQRISAFLGEVRDFSELADVSEPYAAPRKSKPVACGALCTCLPIELLAHIAAFLQATALTAFRETCRGFCQAGAFGMSIGELSAFMISVRSNSQRRGRPSGIGIALVPFACSLWLCDSNCFVERMNAQIVRAADFPLVATPVECLSMRLALPTLSSLVRAIPPGFLSGSQRLVQVELSGTVERIDDDFLCGVRSIETVDLSGLRVNVIGDRFCAECPSLANVKMPFVNESIGDYTFANCSKLHELELVGNFKFIGTEFAQDCGSLRIVDLRRCQLLTREAIRYVQAGLSLEAMHRCTFLV